MYTTSEASQDTPVQPHTLLSGVDDIHLHPVSVEDVIFKAFARSHIIESLVGVLPSKVRLVDGRTVGRDVGRLEGKPTNKLEVLVVLHTSKSTPIAEKYDVEDRQSE